jgi:hypothetical protein
MILEHKSCPDLLKSRHYAKPGMYIAVICVQFSHFTVFWQKSKHDRWIGCPKPTTNDRPPVKGGLTKRYVLQVRFLVFSARKKILARLRWKKLTLSSRHHDYERQPSSGPLSTRINSSGLHAVSAPVRVCNVRTQLNDQLSFSTTKNGWNVRMVGSELDKTAIPTFLLGGGFLDAMAAQT